MGGKNYLAQSQRTMGRTIGITSWVLAVGNLVTMCMFSGTEEDSNKQASANKQASGADTLGCTGEAKQIEDPNDFALGESGESGVVNTGVGGTAVKNNANNAANNPFGSSGKDAELSDVSLYENYMNSADASVGGGNPFDTRGNPVM